jgi:hypothetical protein
LDGIYAKLCQSGLFFEDSAAAAVSSAQNLEVFGVLNSGKCGNS